MSREVVACLCAAWCRLCDDYASVLREVIAEFPGLELAWIDIEDEAELVGEFEVETFPTIVVAGPEGLRFAGPVTPQPETLRRLLRTTVTEGRAMGAGFDATAREFAVRLRARL